MNESYWILSSKHNKFSALEENIEVNTIIVGGGIVGVTCAYLLAKGGIEVAIVDANKIGYGSSGRNTGKITSQHEIIYSKIDKKYGLENAKLYYEANNKALNLIEEIINENNINCNFERKPSYIFTENENYLEDLKDEYNVCKKIGIDCEYHEKLDLPLNIKGAISFKNQAQFNPKRYLDGLVKECVKIGVKVYENTPIVDFKRGKICKLTTKENKIIDANNVVISSHVPWYDGLNFYFAKEKADRSYLLGGELDKDILPGMFLGVEESGITFRVYEDEGKKLLIIGGGDHKVGQCNNEEDIYEKLKNYAKEKFGVKEFKYQWSAQDYMSYDNVPYIGYINKKEEENIYVATGFSKWGMSNGTSSAMIISDLMLLKNSKYKELFNPSRKGSYLSSEFLKENINVGINYIAGKLKIGSDHLPINKGEGKVVSLNSKRYGAYRHYNDKLYIVDNTCTHLGCELHFNSAEKTWDCPCHGSRFDYEGNVLEGPAIKSLNKYGEGKNHIDIKLV